ncbi:hypothetical protein FISHEDRAFT_62784 [Fistulina hepatica ATCC 64428]|uniref:Uncharacterized protein n=1 Tax=Fistulina hepatica ATCC 64428 TaxID=1128425 RepID=A0A0D7A1M7_9AGAR|nr:hypothetical protein FISHEDRAFT_62784 [Fistulina hepatica ATCC 64428]
MPGTLNVGISTVSSSGTSFCEDQSLLPATCTYNTPSTNIVRNQRKVQDVEEKSKGAVVDRVARLVPKNAARMLRGKLESPGVVGIVDDGVNINRREYESCGEDAASEEHSHPGL